MPSALAGPVIAVTTQMIRRISDSYNVTTFDNLHVGFKWIAATMDEKGADKFLFGAEESHGYLVGQYARDKDAAVACQLMAELATHAKAKGMWKRSPLVHLLRHRQTKEAATDTTDLTPPRHTPYSTRNAPFMGGSCERFESH